MAQYQPPRVFVPIFNSDNYTYELLGKGGLSEAEADLLYVKLTKTFQTINGNLQISNGLQVDNGITSTSTITSNQYITDTIPIGSFTTNDIQLNFHDPINGANGTGIASVKLADNTTEMRCYVEGSSRISLRNDETEIFQPLVLPADTALNNNAGFYTILFRNENTPPTAGQLFGIKARVQAPDFPALSFFLNNNEVMGFDRSNMIVRQTFRTDLLRAVGGDIGFRVRDPITGGWGNRFQFYDNSPGVPFTEIGHWSSSSFGIYYGTPLYVGGNSTGRPTDADMYATGIQIVRKCPDATFTFTTNNQSLSQVVSIGKTLPSADYVITMGIEETSASPEGQIGYSISNKTTSQFTINAHSLKIATFVLRPILTLFV